MRAATPATLADTYHGEQKIARQAFGVGPGRRQCLGHARRLQRDQPARQCCSLVGEGQPALAPVSFAHATE